jgi:hypothetical protein
MYKVIKHFVDLHDKNHPYNVGDEFPRAGVIVNDVRIAELAGSNNKQGVPLIEKVEDETAEEKKTPAKRSKKATKE